MRHAFAALVAIVLASALAAGGCSSPTRSAALPADEAAQLLLDRNWMDRMPQTTRERLHVFRFVPSMGGGVFQDRTLFKGTFELFSFEVHGNEVRFSLHETDERVTSAFTIEPVRGPEPFDLKLTFAASPRGPQVYYGMRSETDRDGERLEARLRAARP